MKDWFGINIGFRVGGSQGTGQSQSEGGPLRQLEGCGSSPAEVAPQLLQQLGQMGTQLAGMASGFLMNCMGGCGG